MATLQGNEMQNATEEIEREAKLEDAINILVDRRIG